MFRQIAIIAAGLAGIANLNASYIQIGGNTGLTASTGTTLVTGAEGGYLSSAFQGTAGTAAGTNGSVLCFGTTIGTCATQANSAVPSGEPNNEFATANGVTFAMINGDSNSNVWASANTGTNVFTIPIGIFGVTNVFTMLNDEYGVLNATPTAVKFNFSDSSSETFTLTNGKTIRESIACLGGTGLSTCTTQNYASTLDTVDMFSTTGTNLGAIGPTTTANVQAFNVWSGTYSGGTANRSNTTGNLYLDAQDFYLGTTAAGLTLVNITITDTQGGSTQVSRDLLSAVTVQGAFAAAPEPSTWLLMLTAIGALAFMRRRQKQS